MRCAFKETKCAIANDMACFQCAQCGKQLAVAKTVASRLPELVQTFPECPRGAAASSTENAPASAPAPVKPAQPAPYVWDPTGAGTQLKKLLAKVGIKSTENCSCNARARLMNERGIEWCEQNIKEIVGWLKEEAAKRKLPFLALPTKILVQRAIKLARRARDKADAALHAAVDSSAQA